jgi:hypothetical protein
MPAHKSKFTENVEELCREEWNLSPPSQDWALKEKALFFHAKLRENPRVRSALGLQQPVMTLHIFKEGTVSCTLPLRGCCQGK